MTTEELCQELMMADVVRVDFIPKEGTTVPVPFSIPDQSQMKGAYPTPQNPPEGSVRFAAALLTLGVTYYNNIDAVFKSGGSLKVTSARDAAGIIRTHTLQMPVDRGFQSIRAVLQGIDFYMVLTTYSGAQYFIYTLPNTSQFSLEEQMGESGTLTVKATVKSMSGVIRLT